MIALATPTARQESHSANFQLGTQSGEKAGNTSAASGNSFPVTQHTQEFPDLHAVTSADTIFITGATGFLGGAMAAELLQRKTPATLLFLVRAESPEQGLERLRESLVKFEIDDDLLARLTTRNVICGDLVTVAKFAHDPRLDGVTFAVNCAGVTSFGRNPNIRVVNVEGTLELVRRIAAMPKLRRFIHVSTAMICGSRPPKVVREDLFPQEHSQHFVPYTESKAESERLITQAMQGRPFAIVRPTIIVGHTRLGCAPSHSIFWAFRMGHALRVSTAGIDGRIDIVPVDYAASAVLHLMAKPVLSHHLYHVGSGEDCSSTFGEIDEAFCRALGRPPGIYREATVEEAMARKDEYPALFGPCNKRFMQGAVKLYGSFASLNTVFDISRLRAEGAPPPPRFADYLDQCAKSSQQMTISDQAMTDFL